MARALELAWQGWGRVQPNPLVGAVVLARRRGRRRGMACRVRRAARGGRGARRRREPRARGATLVVHARALRAPGQAAAVHRRAPRAPGRGAWWRPSPIRTRWRPAAPTCLRAARRRGGARPAAPTRPRRRTPRFLHRLRGTPRVPSSRSSWPPRSTAASPTRTDTRAGSPARPARDFVHWLRAGFDALAVGGSDRAGRRPLAHGAGPARAAVHAAPGRLRRRWGRAGLAQAGRGRRGRRRPSWSWRPAWRRARG